MNIGKLRTSLEGVLEGTEIYGLRLAIIKERLWGCTRDLALGVVGVDENGNENPMDDSIDAKCNENDNFNINYKQNQLKWKEMQCIETLLFELLIGVRYWEAYFVFNGEPFSPTPVLGSLNFLPVVLLLLRL